jgi:hypothetical protein
MRVSLSQLEATEAEIRKLKVALARAQEDVEAAARPGRRARSGDRRAARANCGDPSTRYE